MFHFIFINEDIHALCYIWCLEICEHLNRIKLSMRLTKIELKGGEKSKARFIGESKPNFLYTGLGAIIMH